MGIDVLKVTAKIVRDSKGQRANLLKFAYRPSSQYSQKEWNKIHFVTGCAKAEHYVENSPSYTGRVTDGEGNTSISFNSGVISDDLLCTLQWEAEAEDREKEAEAKDKIAKWLQENPQVGILCVKGKEVYYVIRDHKEVRIDPLTQL